MYSAQVSYSMWCSPVDLSSKAPTPTAFFLRIWSVNTSSTNDTGRTYHRKHSTWSKGCSLRTVKREYQLRMRLSIPGSEKTSRTKIRRNQPISQKNKRWNTCRINLNSTNRERSFRSKRTLLSVRHQCSQVLCEITCRRKLHSLLLMAMR